ncbi:hypothetical protein NYE70_13055 [Paenibacillus sp. FSL R5-0407]|uniref:hypothetical protein n=1 Tax=Paenibacillus sp. FSL R5-0407 TaxID=2975320 RepID=UPI0030F723E0
MESTKSIPPVAQTTIDVIKIAAGSDIVPSFEKITPRIYSTPFTALFFNSHPARYSFSPDGQIR